MPDLGRAVTDYVYDTMHVDDRWSERGPVGFSWWGGNLRQQIWSDPPVEDEGLLVWKLHARTDLVRGWSAVEHRTTKLATLGRFECLSGLLYEPDDPTGLVQLAATGYVHEQNEPFAKLLFGLTCAVQAAEAHVAARTLARLDAVEPAVSEHPTSGLRAEPDDMLRVIDGVLAPRGEGPSKWVGEEVLQAVEMVRQRPCVAVSGSETGLTAEYPFGDKTSLLTVEADSTNPRLGRGCLIRLDLPPRFDKAGAAERALEFNRLEVCEFTRTPVTGSWCLGGRGLTHVSFLPNALYKPGVLVNMVIAAALRVQWVTETLFGYDMEEYYETAATHRRDRLARLVGTPEDKHWWEVWK